MKEKKNNSKKSETKSTKDKDLKDLKTSQKLRDSYRPLSYLRKSLYEEEESLSIH